MNSQWIKYDGSDEQIAEMDDADSFIIKANGVESHVMHHIDERGLLVGQPVHIKVENGTGNHLLDVSTGFYYFDLEHSIYVTTTPDWNIPGAEYSFEPFEEEL